jgi:hypothetical protein
LAQKSGEAAVKWTFYKPMLEYMKDDPRVDVVSYTNTNQEDIDINPKDVAPRKRKSIEQDDQEDVPLSSPNIEDKRNQRERRRGSGSSAANKVVEQVTNMVEYIRSKPDARTVAFTAVDAKLKSNDDRMNSLESILTRQDEKIDLILTMLSKKGKNDD